MFDELDFRSYPFPVQIVVYGNRIVRRYAYGEETLEERYAAPVLSRRRRKKLNARRQKKWNRQTLPVVD